MKKPSNWETRTFAEVAEIITGNTPDRKRVEYYSKKKGIPWVKIPDLGKGEISKAAECLTPAGEKYARVLPENTVMVSCIGTIGKVGISTVPVATNQQINSLVFEQTKILPKFGYYYCIFKEDYFKSIAARTVMPTINKSRFSEIIIPVPQRMEQEYIVSLLEASEQILHRKDEALERLNQYIPALFNRVFGDPESSSFNYEMRRLSEIVLKNPQNGIYKHDNFYGRGYPIVRIKNINGGYIDGEEKLERVMLGEEELKKYSLCEGDILVNRVNSIENLGKCASVGDVVNPTVFESNIVRFSVDRYNPRFIALWFSTDYVRQYIKNKAKRAINQASINQKDILEIKVPVVPIEEQNEFVRMLNDYLTIKEHLDFTTERVEKVFKTMLEQAFTGELSVAWRKSKGVYTERKADEEPVVSDDVVNYSEPSVSVKYHKDVHCLEINGTKYLSMKGKADQPIEVPEKDLKKLCMRHIPAGVSIKKLKVISNCQDTAYGKLEYVTVGCDESGSYFAEVYRPCEQQENEQRRAREGETIILGDNRDFIYIKVRADLGFEGVTPISNAIESAEAELKSGPQGYYNRFSKLPQEAKNFVNLLSLHQKALYEEFLLAHDYMAIHTAVKRVNFRMGSKKGKPFGIQDGVQTVSLLEGFGLLEREKIVLPDISGYKRGYEGEREESESEDDGKLTIDLWRWTENMEV